MIHQRKILKAIAYAILLCFTSLTGAQPLYAIPANTQLPTGPYGTVGEPHDVLENVTTVRNGNTLTITQDGKIMRCDSDSGKKLIKSMVLRTADRQGMC